MLLKTEPEPEYLKDWPAHYYDIKDIDQREACLREILKQNPGSEEDLARLDLFNRRFGDRTARHPLDKFMRGWMMIRISDKERLSFLNRRHQEKELRNNLAELCVLDYPASRLLEEEWKDFADLWIHTCTDSSSYKSTMFGMVQTSDRNIALRMANEIDTVTRIVPEKFGLAQECLPLRNIVIAAYINALQDGEKYWNDYLASVR